MSGNLLSLAECQVSSSTFPLSQMSLGNKVRSSSTYNGGRGGELLNWGGRGGGGKCPSLSLTML